MRYVLLGLSWVMSCVILFGLVRLFSPPAAEMSPTGSFDESRLESRIQELERQLAEAQRPAPERLDTRDALLEVIQQRDPGTEDQAKDGARRDAQYHLEQWVLSFADGGQGSEFFRLAVIAYADEVFDPLLALLGNQDSPLLLRRSVVGVLTQARFQGHAKLLGAFMAAVSKDRDEGVANAALDGLRTLGIPATAYELEKLAMTRPTERRRAKVYEVLAHLAGPGTDAFLARLLAVEPAPGLQCALLGGLNGADQEADLEAFQLASRYTQPVRLAGAQKIGQFRAEPFQDFVKQWISVESDEAVRTALRAALHAQESIPSWHAMAATGEPDADPPTRDNPKAWAPASSDGGPEWLELTYEPINARKVRIHEVCAAGAVTKVEVQDPSGRWIQVWSGHDPLTTPGIFEVSFGSLRVQRVRVHLDTRLSSGWNEIDAVELVGSGARGWATSAVASSTYGQGRSSIQVGSGTFELGGLRILDGR